MEFSVGRNARQRRRGVTASHVCVVPIVYRIGYGDGRVIGVPQHDLVRNFVENCLNLGSVFLRGKIHRTGLGSARSKFGNGKNEGRHATFQGIQSLYENLHLRTDPSIPPQSVFSARRINSVIYVQNLTK